ncbi:MAG: hypothetical protein ABH835_02610 [Patescibacteria group bacterium]
MEEKSKSANKNADKNKNLKKVISYLLVIFLVPAFVMLAFFSTLSATVFNPDFHKNNLVEANTYVRLINDGVPSIVLNVKSENDDIYDYLIRRGVIYLFQQFVTPEWLESKANLGIDQIYTFISTPGSPDEYLNKIETFRTQYLLNASKQISIIQTSIPICEDQNNALKLFMPNVDCTSMNHTLDEIRNELGDIQVRVAKIEVQLNEASLQLEKYIKIIFALKNFVSNLTTYIWINSVLCLLAMLVLGLLQFKNIASMLKWVATPFLIASILILIKGYVLDKILALYINSLTLNITPEMDSIIYDVLNLTNTNIWAFMKTFGWIAFGLSLAMLVAGYVIERVNWKKVHEGVKKTYSNITHDKKKKKIKKK